MMEAVACARTLTVATTAASAAPLHLGTTRTISTLTSTGTPTTTQTTSTLPLVLLQTGLWDHSGPCVIDFECVGPPSDKMQADLECFFEPPKNSIVKVTGVYARCDRDSDHLSVGGRRLNHSSRGQLSFPADIIRWIRPACLAKKGAGRASSRRGGVSWPSAYFL